MELQNHIHKHEDREIKKLLEFKINEMSYFLPHGFYLVSDLKRISRVPECHILAEIRNGQVDDMSDDTATHIEGCEIFKSYPGKGQNS